MWIFLFFGPLVSFFSQRKHLLLCLLCLEGSVLMLVFISFMVNISGLVICVSILSFGVCEASVGLALLVSLSRRYGNDILSSCSVSNM